MKHAFKKLFKRIACLFLGHNFVYQYHRTDYYKEQISERHFVYCCKKCNKYKSKKIKF